MSLAGGGTSEERADEPARVPADNPIRRVEDDVLGRSKAARAFADQMLALDASEGVVVGVLGPWGSGKTSFVNLARVRLDELGVPVLDFNPWMFSGAEQLVESFFIEIAAQLKLKPGLSDLGQTLEEYGEVFSGLGKLPLVGPWVDGLRATAELLTKLLESRRAGAGGRRERVEKALEALERPLVVVLDDLDRLTTAEIRDIFKLVRLTASFPNIVYVVAFDRKRVEAALEEHSLPGRAYLEKIVQLGVDLPAIPESVLQSQVFEAIDRVVDTCANPGVFDAHSWPDVYMGVIRPLVRNMRDVRRYIAALSVTIGELEGKVALVDVLGLEAVRVFLPDVHGALHASVDGLTTTTAPYVSRVPEAPHLKVQVTKLIDEAGDSAPVVRSLLERLFPAAMRHVGGTSLGPDWKMAWLRDRRVAHEEVLRFYLERVEGYGLQSFAGAEQAWGLLADGPSLDSFLRSIPPDRLEDVIASLEAYSDQFRHEHAVPGSVVLLNLLPELPERPRGMFDFGSRTVVRRVVYRIVRRLGDPAAVEAAVRTILPQLASLSSKWELVTMVGHMEHVGHKLVTEAVAADLEVEFRDALRNASPERLAGEQELLRMMLVMQREVNTGEAPLVCPGSPEVTLALLRSARSESRSQSVGSRVVHRSPRLAWDALVELFGDEAVLEARIAELRVQGVGDGNDELLELAEKYASGWRPEPFGED